MTGYQFNGKPSLKLLDSDHSVIYECNRRGEIKDQEMVLLEHATFDHDNPSIFLFNTLSADNGRLIAEKIFEIRPPYSKSRESRIDPIHYLSWRSTDKIHIGRKNVFGRLKEDKNTRGYVPELRKLINDPLYKRILARINLTPTLLRRVS